MKDIIGYLKKIWTGTCSKKEYVWYFIVIFSIYVIGTIISAMVYPGGFSMTNVYISYLGGKEENPFGHQIYNAGEIITGFLLIPHFIYLYRQLLPANKVISFLSCLFGVIGFVGFATIGIWHQGVEGPGHSITTYLAFGGFGLSAFLMFFLLIQKLYLKHSWPKWWSFLLVYGLMLGLLFFTLILDNFPNPFINLGISEEYMGDRFLEWLYFFTVLIWIIGIVLITEEGDNVNKQKNK